MKQNTLRNKNCIAELDSLLNIDKKGNDGMVLDMPDETLQKQHSYDMER